MTEERKLPRVGGSRTLNPDGTEATAPKVELKLETKPTADTTFARTTKRKPKE